MIAFNVPPSMPEGFDYIRQAVEGRKISGDGPFTQCCSEWMEQRFDCRRVLLTTSGSTALDMAAMLCDLKPGDEVICPSYTFTTTAAAFVNRGATAVFVDVRPDTMNIDAAKVAAAITERTRVIVVVHYAGVACDMDAIMALASQHGLLVVEDAAQGVMSAYRGRALGTIGHLGCYSFHETKNYSMGEGGALCVNDERFVERAEVIREKGTDRSKFLRGQVDKYTWIDIGSSFLPSDMNAAYLWAQLEHADEMHADRMATWNAYHAAFAALGASGRIGVPHVPDGCCHNAHMYYLKCADLEDRTRFIAHMKERGVLCVFHYIPLHSSPAGKRFGRFCGADEWTTRESERLVRLPLYYGMAPADRDAVIQAALDYFA